MSTSNKITLPDGREVDEWLFNERFAHSMDRHEYSEPPQVPCKFCLRPSHPTDRTCDGCWEVTTRLDGFLQDGGELAVATLVEALLHAKTPTREFNNLKGTLLHWLVENVSGRPRGSS